MNIKSRPIDIKLRIELKGKFLIAHLIFFNGTDKRFYLDKHTICYDSKFTRNVFSIIDDHHNMVNYTGEKINRYIAPEEFIWLEVGEYAKTSVILNEGYKIRRGNRYLIQYAVFSLGYLQEQEIMRIESNKVAVMY